MLQEFCPHIIQKVQEPFSHKKCETWFPECQFPVHHWFSTRVTWLVKSLNCYCYESDCGGNGNGDNWVKGQWLSWNSDCQLLPKVCCKWHDNWCGDDVTWWFQTAPSELSKKLGNSSLIDYRPISLIVIFSSSYLVSLKSLFIYL